jgi:poly-gamma-glutamate synthesis protein (capsule biosynthesis protein)
VIGFDPRTVNWPRLLCVWLWCFVLATGACHKTHAPAARIEVGTPRFDDVVEPTDDTPDVTDVAPVVDAGRPRRVVVTLTGDVVLHRAVLETLTRHRANGGFAWSLNWLTGLITPREVALTTLSSPLTDAHRVLYSGAPPVLGAPREQVREMVRDLRRVGIDGVCLASQHAYDQMGDGLVETAEALRGGSLGVAGTGASADDAWKPWIAEREGIRVAWLCFTQRVLQGIGRNNAGAAAAISDDGARALEAVTAARNEADVVVVGVQWYRAAFRPLSADQRALARNLVEAGADVVVGSGAVAPGVVERTRSPRGDAVILWSVGTLFSNYGSLWRGRRNPAPTHLDRTSWDPSARDVALVRAQFDLSNPERLSIVTLTANGLWTQHSSEGVRLLPLRSITDYDLREDRARALGAALGPEVRLRQ